MSSSAFDNTDLSKAAWVFYVSDSHQLHVPKTHAQLFPTHASLYIQTQL